MKKILFLLLATSSIVAFADDMSNPNTAPSMSPSMAAAPSSTGSSSGIYGGLGVGAAWNDAVAPATSFRGDVGYNFTDNWALEVGTTGVTQSGGAGNQSMQFYDLSVKGTLPLGDVLAIFGQLGGAYASPGIISSANIIGTNQLQAGWDFFSAAGVQLNVTRQVSLNLTDYFYYGSPNPQGNTDVLLAGIKYNF